MPRQAKPLTALEVKQLKTPGLHFVGDVPGLALQIASGGSRSWVLRAMMGGRRREMGLGGYPEVGLADAREAGRQARARLKGGVDPIDHGRATRSALAARRATEASFEECALKYIAIHEPSWSTKSHFQWTSSLKKHVFPKIGRLLVRDVGDAQVLSVLEPIWVSLTETATRIRGRIEKIIDWATASKLREGPNPARWRGHLEHMLPNPSEVAEEEHFKALPYQQLGAFMKRLRSVEGQGARCLEFAILTAARSTQARGAAWTEIDTEGGLWVIPKERMKGNRDHRVPLSKPALQLLAKQPKIDGTDLVFPGATNKMLSDATLGAVMDRLEVDAVPHGFRSTFKDWASELTTYPNELSELALAHLVGDKVEQAYRRGDMFEKRRKIMSDWATFCSREWEARPAAVVRKLRS
jgi:integrase